MDFEYSNRIVAFIDILGFGALVSRLGEEPKLHAKLHRALTEIGKIKNSSLEKNTAQTGLVVSVFSDSVVISGAPDNLNGVIWSSIHLQCSLLALGILIRGGISRGKTVHTGDILYGEGMLNAYHLESKAAIYPRIIIDPIFVPEIESGYKAMFLAQDADGLWFIDPFAMGIVPGNVDTLLENGYDPSEEGLKFLGKEIDKEISRLSDASQLAKWSWLKNRHAIATLEFAKFKRPRLWHILEEVQKAEHS